MDLRTLLLPLGGIWAKIVKCVPAIVAEVEKAMQDGKIDASERKSLALKAIDVVAAEFGVKLNWITRWVISWIIDQVAKRLPSKDLVIPSVISAIVKKVNE